MSLPTRARQTALRAAQIAAIGPIVQIFLYIHRFGVKSLYWDDWELVPYLDDMYSGHLTVARLFAQHNEHRILFPRLVMLGMARLTAHDNVALMYVTGVLVIGAAAVILWQHLATFGCSPGAWALFVPLGWMFLTLRQEENLLWGWQVQIAMCTSTFVGAAALLRHPERRRGRLVGAALLAGISTFSFAAGLAAWPALLGYLGFHHVFRRSAAPRGFFLRSSAIWAAFGAGVWTLYLHGYVKPPYHPSTAFALHHPLAAVNVFVATIGDCFSFDPLVAAMAGAAEVALVAVAAVALWRGRVDAEKIAPAVPLLLFVTAVVTQITAGRAGFGLGVALWSRYVTFTVLGFAGAYWSVLALPSGSFRSGVIGVIAAGVLVSIVTGDLTAMERGDEFSRDRRAGSALLLRADKTTEGPFTTLLYPSREVVLQDAEILRKYRLNVFADR